MLSVAVPPGIGDCHWVACKLKAFRERFGPVNAFVHPSRTRHTREFLELIPYIDRVTESHDGIMRVWTELEGTHRHPRWATLDGCKGANGFDYVLIPNGHLETGGRLEDWLPELDTEWCYPLDIPAKAHRWAASYRPAPVLLYPSGAKPNDHFHRGTWTPEMWVPILEHFRREGIPCLVVGAPVDSDYEIPVTHTSLVGRTNVAQIMALIQRARLLIGFQSGLPIMSAAMGVPTIMMWSNADHPIEGVAERTVLPSAMQTSWLPLPTPAHYRTVSFGHDATPERILEHVADLVP